MAGRMYVGGNKKRKKKHSIPCYDLVWGTTVITCVHNEIPHENQLIWSVVNNQSQLLYNLSFHTIFKMTVKHDPCDYYKFNYLIADRTC